MKSHIQLPFSGEMKFAKSNLTNKQIKLSGQLKNVLKKIDNKSFIDRAPKHIVEQEKNIYNNLKINIEKITFTINSLK